MQDYNVIGEVDVAPTPDRAVGWMDALAPYSPAVGRTDRGRSELIITVPGHSLEQAIATGLAVLARAAGQLTALRAMTTEEYDQRSADVDLPDMVGATEAADIIGISRQRVQQLAALGQLPSRLVGKSLLIPRSNVEHLAKLRREGRTVDG